MYDWIEMTYLQESKLMQKTMNEVLYRSILSVSDDTWNIPKSNERGNWKIKKRGEKLMI